jgi:Ca-activated chloride channel homolog
MDKLISTRTAAWTLGATGLALVATWRLGLRDGAAAFSLLGRSWQVAEPAWLLLLLLAVPHLLLSGRGGPPLKRRVLLGLRLSWLALAILALAGPALERRTDRVSVAALIDVSSSVTEPDLVRASDLLARLAEQARRQGSNLSVLRFAALPSPVPPGQGPSRFPGAEAEESDLALALGSGLSRLEPDRVGRLLLVSDGRATRGDLLQEAERARQRGVRVFVHPLIGGVPPEPAAAGGDVALASLTGPTSVQPGESFELEARIAATHPARARLQLLRDDRPAGPGSERSVSLDRGVSVVRFTGRLEGETPASYRLEIAEAAPNAERRNDALTLAVAPQSRPRVLIAEPVAGTTAAFRRALQAEQVDVQVVVGAGLANLDRFGELDLIVLSDLGTGLTEASAAALDRFVRDQGGGLLVSGGPEGGGAAGPGRTRFEALLPITYDTTEQKEEATLALGLIIDRSGSMSGPKMDLTKEAARGAAELMNAQDLITVVTFDSQAQTVVRLQPASNRQRILSDIAQVRASGGTNVLPGLQEAFDQLLAARARKKHAIVLSDGQSPAEGVRELVDEAAAAGITVSAVGVGDGADLALLQTIAARGGGRFYHTRDPSSIPRIFTRETTRLSPSNLVESPSRIRKSRPARATQGIPFASAPPLGGYARARPKRGAEVLLTSGGGDPLLARWHLGLGQVLTWTSDVTPRWSAEWLRWRHFNKLWGQLVRSALRRQGDRTLPLSVSLEADRALVQIRAFDSEDRPLPGLTGNLEVVDVAGPGAGPSGPPRSIPLLAVGGGGYRAEVPLGQAKALLFSADLRGDSREGPLRLSARGQLSVPPLRELLPPGAEQAGEALSGPELLRALAARTGGGEVGAEGRGSDLGPLLDAGSDRVDLWWPLRRALLAAALLLFLAEIASRRANFRRPDHGRGIPSPTRSG